MSLLPEKLSKSVKNLTSGIPWNIDKERGTISILFGRKYDPEHEFDDSHLLVKKYEILIAIRDFYKKYFEEVN